MEFGGFEMIVIDFKTSTFSETENMDYYALERHGARDPKHFSEHLNLFDCISTDARQRLNKFVEGNLKSEEIHMQGDPKKFLVIQRAVQTIFLILLADGKFTFQVVESRSRSIEQSLQTSGRGSELPKTIVKYYFNILNQNGICLNTRSQSKFRV